jgi:hypothetical protein
VSSPHQSSAPVTCARSLGTPNRGSRLQLNRTSVLLAGARFDAQ